MIATPASTKRDARCDRRVASNGTTHAARVHVKQFRSCALIATTEHERSAVAVGWYRGGHGASVRRSYLRRVP